MVLSGGHREVSLGIRGTAGPRGRRLGSANDRTSTAVRKHLPVPGRMPRARHFDNCLIYTKLINSSKQPWKGGVIITTSGLRVTKPGLRENEKCVPSTYSLVQSRDLGPGLADTRALAHHRHAVLPPYTQVAQFRGV